MVRSRKASLSLSINAIVILVLAITMLGLGLAFTKGMFGKLSSKLSVPEPDIPATADDTIVLPNEELVITKNKQFVFSANAYNDDFTGNVYGKLECAKVDAQGATADEPAKLGIEAIAVCSGPQAIEPGEDKGFKFIIPKGQVERSSTRVCTIGFSGVGDTVPDCETFKAMSAEQTKQVVVTIR